MDALSWKVRCIYEISFSEVHTTFKEQIKEATIHDPTYKFLWQQAKNTSNN